VAVKTKPSKQTVLRILAVVFVIAITVTIFLFRERVREFAGLGYPGIFLIVMIAYATILVPVPAAAIVFTMGGVFNPIGVGLAAGCGAVIGEVSGYLAGYGGQAVIENWKMYEKMSTLVNKYGGPAILVLSAIPNPFFDLVGVAAGALKIPVHKFMLWCWPGQIIKMMIFAYTGSSSLNLIFQ